MIKLDKIAREIIAVNRANGWDVTEPEDFPGKEAKLITKLALIHSEVSEALEAFRDDDFWGFAEELADIVIRILDLLKGLGCDCRIPSEAVRRSGSQWRELHDIPVKLFRVHQAVSASYQAVGQRSLDLFEGYLTGAMGTVFGLAKDLNIDLCSQIIHKVGKNRGRGFRHGGKKV